MKKLLLWVGILSERFSHWILKVGGVSFDKFCYDMKKEEERYSARKKNAKKPK